MMLFITLLWRILVIIYAVNLTFGQRTPPIRERIPYYLTQLCPGANVCRNNTSLEESPRTYDSGKMSCCKECSCNPDCGYLEHCCFDKYVDLSDDFTTSSGMSKSGWECLSTVTASTRGEIPSFYMITSSSYNNNGDVLEHEPCRTKSEAPWGSLYPVFSNKTKQIYINEACAKANNVTDAILWNAYLLCDETNAAHVKNDDANFFAFIEKGEMPSYCRTLFSYPGDLKDVASKQCFTHLIDKCTSTDFQVPTYLPATKEDIIDACESGLDSPYWNGRGPRYANVFCHICSGAFFRQDQICQDNDYKSALGVGKFVALLNAKMVKTVEGIDASKPKQELPTVCPHDTEKGALACRFIKCPSGQLRNTQGHCMHATKTWYNQVYIVGLRLRTNSSIEIRRAFPLLNDNLYRTDDAIISPLISPWPKQWFINEGFYEVVNGTNNALSNSLVLFLTYTKPIFYPDVGLQSINRLLTQTWYLQYQTKTLVFTSELFRQKIPHIYDVKTTDKHFSVNSSATTKLTIPRWNSFFYSVSTKNVGFPLRLSKLYFCEQIDLKTEEYILYEGGKVLYNKVAQNYLFDGEFTILFGYSDVTARICVVDSGFKRTELSGSVNAQKTYLPTYASYAVLVWYSLVYLHRVF